MPDSTEWVNWIHAALVVDLSNYLVGNTDAIQVSRKTATEIGNRGHVWSLNYYESIKPPTEVTTALQKAKEASIVTEKNMEM